ncbi:MAG TPA: hypothetical protein VHT91_03365 [Kofleriaceae bacterium]|jgi:hypothetical protein|nr:hypothetical protein [Kofleriaceae bacterium]
MLDERALAWGQPVRLAGSPLHEAGAAGLSFEGVRHSTGSVRTDEDSEISGFRCRQREARVEDCRGVTVALPDAPCITRTRMRMRRALLPFAPHRRQYLPTRAGVIGAGRKMMKRSRSTGTCGRASRLERRRETAIGR